MVSVSPDRMTPEQRRREIASLLANGIVRPHALRRLHAQVHRRGTGPGYNSIDAQRDAGHAYVSSPRAEGWIPVADDYDDPAFPGGNMERPALRRLMADIAAGKIDVAVTV